MSFARRIPAQRGMSIVEMLVALAITSVLLVATAAAFHGTFHSYDENQRIADATGAARLMIHQVMARARRSAWMNVSPDGRVLEVESSDDLDHRYIYAYSPDTRQVLLSRMHSTTMVVEPLGSLDDVESFSIPSAQWMENPPILTLTMTVRCGANSATLSSSAIPRSTVAF